jgi:uncharacterized membrane protein YbhN (UPF0104 family)
MNERIDIPNSTGGGEADLEEETLQPTNPTRGQWNWLLVSLKIGLTLAALGLILYSVDLPAAWRFAREQDARLLVAAAALMFGQIAFGGGRWFLILRRLQSAIAFSQCMKIYYISVFFSACLWASVGGDLVRGWLAFQSKVSAKVSAISVIVDRIAALAGVSIIVLATASVLVKRVGDDHALMAVIPIALAAMGLMGIVIAAQLRRIPSNSWGSLHGLRHLRVLGDAMHQVFLAPTWTTPILLSAVIAQICGSLGAYVIAHSLGLGISLLDCLVLMQPVTLLAALPISIGGWGVREAAVVTLFGFVGVPSSAALVLSLQIGLINIIVSLPGGMLFLMQKSKLPIAYRTKAAAR